MKVSTFKISHHTIISERRKGLEEKITHFVGHILNLYVSSTGVNLGDVDAARCTGAHRTSRSRIIAGLLGGRFRGRHLLGTGTSTLLSWGGCQMEPGEDTNRISNAYQLKNSCF